MVETVTVAWLCPKNKNSTLNELINKSMYRDQKEIDVLI